MDDKNNIGIYKITSKETGNFYIGSSQELIKRKQNHFSALNKGKHPNRYLQRSWNKRKDLLFEIIEVCDINDLIIREQFYMDTLKPIYNLRPIAESNRGWEQSESSKNKISKANVGKNISEEHKQAIGLKNSINLKGKPLKDSHIIAIKKARIGTTLSEETKNKIRIKAIGRDKGKILSKETKEKIGLASSKKVYQYDLNDNYITSFVSCSEVERVLNINNASVASCCRGIRKTAGKFKWYYEKQNN